jgi:hypothetical protein
MEKNMSMHAPASHITTLSKNLMEKIQHYFLKHSQTTQLPKTLANKLPWATLNKWPKISKIKKDDCQSLSLTQVNKSLNAMDIFHVVVFVLLVAKHLATDGTLEVVSIAMLGVFMVAECLLGFECLATVRA